MIYLDNAATSWPKAPGVIEAMADAMRTAGGNPGRSGHRLSVAAARLVYDARENLARFFGVSDPSRVVFTANATHALNQAIRGLVAPGDRVIVTGMEHNAVMRPLRDLETQGVEVTVVPAEPDGWVPPAALQAALGRPARLVVATHASNVTGTLLPIAEFARIAHETGAWLVVDAAQTAGAVPIHLPVLGADLLAFTGHKELYGPPGIGGLVIADHFDPAVIRPLVCGGTGSGSESELQPCDLPDRFESGTPNLPGIAGLGASLAWLCEFGFENIRAHRERIHGALLDGLADIPGLRVYGTGDVSRSVAIVSVTLGDQPVSRIGHRLDQEFGILTRVGLHCAPAAHRSVGSFPGGTVRLAPGLFTTETEVEQTLEALLKVAAQ
jgi:cysteine desulfurase family protein